MVEFGWQPEYEAFREEVRSFLAALKTPELEEEIENAEQEALTRGPLVGQINDRLDAQGWVKMCWPAELGGQGRSLWYQFVLHTELEKAGIPFRGVPFMAPAIERFGSDEAKKRYLPGLWSGSLTCALGYSEPNAGTDLASLETRAIRDGDEWVINGQKIWTSGAHISTHVWLAARTDPSAPKHRGISMFVVPLDSAGLTVRPIYTVGGLRTNEVFFEDVRVPSYALIGEENRGWYIAAHALDVERVGLGGGIQLRHDYDRYLGHLKEDRPEVIEDGMTRRRLAEFKLDVNSHRAIALKNSTMVANGHTPTMEASMSKVLNSEVRQRFLGTGMDQMGRYGALSRGAEDAPMNGRFEQTYRGSPVSRFGGGTNEVQRNIIAQRGLGLPR